MVLFWNLEFYLITFKFGILLHLTLPIIQICLLLNKDQGLVLIKKAYRLPISVLGFTVYV